MPRRRRSGQGPEHWELSRAASGRLTVVSPPTWWAGARRLKRPFGSPSVDGPRWGRGQQWCAGSSERGPPLGGGQAAQRRTTVFEEETKAHGARGEMAGTRGCALEGDG